MAAPPTGYQWAVVPALPTSVTLPSAFLVASSVTGHVNAQTARLVTIPYADLRNLLRGADGKSFLFATVHTTPDAEPTPEAA